MPFDPFGDFETRGYLRNRAGEKNIAIVKRLEHTSFLTGIDAALAMLGRRQDIRYEDVLKTHELLFDAIYPWAGQDRVRTAPSLTIRKGDVIFANPAEIRAAVEYGLHLGQNREAMAARPGEVMGYLAFGHPFLDGNGRTIMTIHAIMSQRAGFGIDWSATDKHHYLDALTQELARPGKGVLDQYLHRYMSDPHALDQLPANIAGAPGLGGSIELPDNEVLGESTSPEVSLRYEAMMRKRSEPS